MGTVPTRIGATVVGYGYWGPNLVRNLIDRPEFELLGLCEIDEARAAPIPEPLSGLPGGARLRRASSTTRGCRRC